MLHPTQRPAGEGANAIRKISPEEAAKLNLPGVLSMR
jgi:hypothetical protein